MVNRVTLVGNLVRDAESLNGSRGRSAWSSR